MSLLFFVHFVSTCAFCDFFNCGFDVVTAMTHFCYFHVSYISQKSQQLFGFDVLVTMMHFGFFMSLTLLKLQ